MDEPALATVREAVAQYYAGRLARHGATPRGVDWWSMPSQELRFVQLLRICDFAAPFSLNDVGCGYGAILSYLDRRHPDAEVDYLGIDLAESMIAAANRLWRERPKTAFVVADRIPRTADYCIASGIFNVKLDVERALWERFIACTLADMHARSAKGFAFNLMIARDGEAADDRLYHARPESWAEHCEKAFGCRATVLGGYGQPEVTLLVRRGNP